MPRWSRLLTGAAAQEASLPKSIALLPRPGNIVLVEPPLGCSGPRFRTALLLAST